MYSMNTTLARPGASARQTGTQNARELLGNISPGNRARAFHVGLRGVDTYAFRDLKAANPIDHTVICCDFGKDHGSMMRNGTRKVISLARGTGIHKDWSTDHIEEIPSLPQFRELINSATLATPVVLIPFKNQASLEMIRSRAVQLLAPSYDLVHYFDSKLNLPKILASVGIRQIPGEIVQREEFTQEKFDAIVERYGKKLVAQQAYGSGGSGTFIVGSKQEIDAIFAQNGSELKISKFIEGPSFNGQACVMQTTEGMQSAVFNPSFQIIGDPNLTDWPTYYCGNDFTNALKGLGKKGTGEYTAIMQKIGTHMGEKGWRGVFGVDFIYNPEEQRIYVVEINPRLQASTSFLHMRQEEMGAVGIGTYHLLSLLANEPLPAHIASPALLDLKGSHVLINNRVPSIVTVKGNIEAGVFSLDSGSMRLEQEHHWTTTGKGKFLVTCGVPETGTKVEGHATILKIYSPEQAIERNGNTHLTDQMANVVKRVYRALKLE
jgi:hypothetical protein